ncbi:UspA domain-containing protein [Thermodesulfatator indicus DSM 15286]|uniref:UspA domain-containing protein n=1 Tax=Thermodesulfatator indicus (strain DSM 15286 / JCM 11887 / CIR29812) TaxID=667014 RepID=F8A8L3_THEID|nr:universal stress protein [Thermodesulfatator indicus]AEH45099.1 UspA domain-containing protein [Thermodesulfatator indicus DSM 15286]
MNRHILLATDSSTYSQKAVSYLATLFKDAKNFEITVFCVAPAPPSYLLGPVPGLNELERQEKLEKIQAENVTWANKCVTEAKEALVREGFSEDQIHTKITIQRGDLARIILREAHDGKYDAVVAGRRGLGRLSSWWVGSVTQKLVEYGQNVPVWIVDGQKWNKRFLVPVDLGETGLKVIDHLGFILAENPQAEIELLHIIPSLIPGEESRYLAKLESSLLEKEQKEAQEFFQEVQKILKDTFDILQVKVKIKRSPHGVASIILKEAKEGNFGTVVMGRRGRGGFKELLLGSTSSKVLYNLTDRSLWIVR